MASPHISTILPDTTIKPLDPKNPSHVTAARSLIAAYTAWLGLDLSFQSYDEEIATLPGKYASERGGELLLAFARPIDECLLPVGDDGAPQSGCSIGEKGFGEDGKPIGVIAVRNLPYPYSSSQGSSGRRRAELKRLWVDPDYRRYGIGVELVRQILEVVDALGYDECVLDTLPSMVGAQKMYEKFGFKRIERYYDTVIEGTIFMGRERRGDNESKVE